MTRYISFQGMVSFILMWFGQLVSVLGSSMTAFALGVWVYQQTGSVTQIALISFSYTLPNLLVSPLAGVLADRWDRRWVIILSDSGGALGTLALALLIFTQQLQVWHIYLIAAVISLANAFQWPAYYAAMPMLVPKQQLGRVNGIDQFGQALLLIGAPFLGGVLLVTLQLRGVILIDLLSYLFAVSMLLIIRIPKPETTEAAKAGQDSILHEIVYGWKYLVARSGLLGLMILFAIFNFLASTVNVLVTPLVLSVTSPTVLGGVMSVGGIGMLLGSLLMSVWGGPKRQIYGVLGFMIMAGLAIAFAGIRPYVPIFFIAAFGVYFALPLVNGGSQAIWQRKVAPEVQGRTFGLSGMIARAAMPIAYLVAGPLTDYVFEPLLSSDGPLASSVGRIIGTGPGRGIGLLFIVFGLSCVLVTIGGYLHPRIRLLDEELPDVIADEPSTEVEEAPQGPLPEPT